MTVEELREELSRLPPTATVLIRAIVQTPCEDGDEIDCDVGPLVYSLGQVLLTIAIEDEL